MRIAGLNVVFSPLAERRWTTVDRVRGGYRDRWLIRRVVEHVEPQIYVVGGHTVVAHPSLRERLVAACESVA